MNLRESIIADMKHRGSYNPLDEHMIDLYVKQYEIVEALFNEIEEEGAVVIGQNGETNVANPALVRIQGAISTLQAQAKMLGLTPYGRKLTTGEKGIAKKQGGESVVSQLRPINRKKAK